MAPENDDEPTQAEGSDRPKGDPLADLGGRPGKMAQRIGGIG